MTGRDPWAYGRPLTYPMRTMLSRFSPDGTDWLSVTNLPTQTLHALQRRGLVKAEDCGRHVRLTATGLRERRKLKQVRT